MLDRCALYHRQFRLPALARIRRSVWTIIDPNQPGAALFQLTLHQLVHFRYDALRKIAARHTRLIAHDNHRIVRVVQLRDRRCGTGQHAKPARVIQVTDFVENCPVAIQKYSRTQRLAARQKSPPQFEREPRFPPSPESPLSCNDDRSGTAAKSTDCSMACPETPNKSASPALSPSDPSVRTPPPPAIPPPRRHALRRNHFQ